MKLNQFLIGFVVILVLLGTGYLLTKSQPSPVSIAGWKTFTDTKQGISFQYPEKLSTTYITAQDWPPTVKILSGVAKCAVEPFILNGRSYCVKAQTDGAAGSVYTTYLYAVATQDAKRTIEVSFTLRSVQCANYDEPTQTTCNNERKSLNVDNLVDKMVSTVRFSSVSKT